MAFELNRHSKVLFTPITLKIQTNLESAKIVIFLHVNSIQLLIFGFELLLYNSIFVYVRIIDLLCKRLLRLFLND